MTIQPISKCSVALYLTGADLRLRGLQAEALTAEDTLELIREAFRQAGLSLNGAPEIETYSHKCGLLVFIRTAFPAQSVWQFEDCDALLSAAAVLNGEETDGALYWWEGHFWLVLSDCSDPADALLSEFGCRETDDPYIPARLQEYGTPLLSNNALSVLHRHFAV